MTDEERLVAAVRTVIRLARIAQQVCEQVGLTLPQYRALSMSVRVKRRAHEIATYSAVSRPAVAALTAGMEKLKLIERQAVEEDGRGVTFVASAKGRKLLQDADRQMLARYQEILGDNVDILRVLAAPAFDRALDHQAEREFGTPDQVFDQATLAAATKPSKSSRAKPRRRQVRK